MELLKQGQGEPYPVEEEVVSIFLGTRGHLDSVPVEDVARFETEFLEHVRRDGGILAEIRDTGQLSDENEERLTKAVSDFKEQFSTGSGEGVADDGGSGELLGENESGTDSDEGPSESSDDSETDASSNSSTTQGSGS